MSATSTPSTLPAPSGPPPDSKPKPSKSKKNRRAPGEGSIYERKSDGKWCATWTETLANGMKKKRIVYGASKREALDKRTEAMREAENATKETVGLFMRRWLESHSSKLRPTSRAKYADAIRLYIAPEKDTGRGRGIGWILLSKLSPLDIETWIAAMEKLGIPPSRRREVCVTPSLAGTPIRKGSLSDVFVRITKRAGVKRIRFHDLRHTNATLLIGKGMDPKTVSSRLGHSSIMITLDTYAKFMPEADPRAAGIMADVFKTG